MTRMSEGNEPERRSIRDVIERMERIEARLAPDDARRHFHSTYLRTTRAVASELDKGGFLDAGWLETLDVVFADLYLDAFDAWEREEAPRAWQVPFSTARDRPELQALRHVLFGANVHVNFDLPLAIIEVTADEEFDDPAAVARREQDHIHIDSVLASRVRAEDRELPGRTLSDRLLAPLNHRATKKFLTEARAKAWRNARVLSRTRREHPGLLADRVDELDRLCAARARDLVEPGQIILKLARRGFGVLLPDA